MRSLPALRLALLVAAPIVFFLLPFELIEHGPNLCLFKATIGWTCPGCGMTRALHLLMHGELSRSVSFNPRVVVAAPLLAFIWGAALVQSVRAALRSELRQHAGA
jgi:hypothetical protein